MTVSEFVSAHARESHVTFGGLGGLGWGWAAGLVQKTYFPVCILCLLTSLLAHPVVLHQKGTT